MVPEKVVVLKVVGAVMLTVPSCVIRAFLLKFMLPSAVVTTVPAYPSVIVLPEVEESRVMVPAALVVATWLLRMRLPTGVKEMVPEELSAPLDTVMFPEVVVMALTFPEAVP
jgi:hypothetical protein